MPQAFMDATGFRIALPGHDARTALGSDLLFNSDDRTITLHSTGLVTVANTTLSNPPYMWHNAMRYAWVPFAEEFANPPMVYVCGIVDSNTRDVGSFSWFNIVTAHSSNYSEACYIPNYCLRVLTTGFHIWTVRASSGLDGGSPSGFGCTVWRYFILENPL